MHESFKQMLHTDVGWEFPQAAVVVCESWSHSTICKINLCENLHTSTSWNIWFHQFIQAELRRWFFFSQVEPLLLLWKGGYFVSTWVKRGFLRSAKVKPRNDWIWPPRSKRLTSQHSLAKKKKKKNQAPSSWIRTLSFRRVLSHVHEVSLGPLRWISWTRGTQAFSNAPPKGIKHHI